MARIRTTAEPGFEPVYASEGAAGSDLRAHISEPLELQPGSRAAVPTGVHIELPPGFEAQIRPRSGLALRHGISLVNSPGTIDCDYRGEIVCILVNHGETTFTVERGMRIAQMVVSRVERGEFEIVESLSSSDRGSNGFGSTGLH